MDELPVNINSKKEDKSLVLISVTVIILAAFMIILLVFNMLYTRIYVVGESMQSTLKGAPSVYEAGGDYVYICKYIEPKRGDIVVIDAGERSLIKRVIALGGDSVKMENGVLYLKESGDADYHVVEEPYVNPERNKDPIKNTFGETVVKEDYMFFMGDNRDNSEDSRGSFYGMMPVERVTGVVTGWSLQCKDAITNWNTFFEFTLPDMFGAQNNE